jgi:hypothetical protein
VRAAVRVSRPKILTLSTGRKYPYILTFYAKVLISSYTQSSHQVKQNARPENLNSRKATDLPLMYIGIYHLRKKGNYIIGLDASKNLNI